MRVRFPIVGAASPMQGEIPYVCIRRTQYLTERLQTPGCLNRTGFQASVETLNQPVCENCPILAFYPSATPLVLKTGVFLSPPKYTKDQKPVKKKLKTEPVLSVIGVGAANMSLSLGEGPAQLFPGDSGLSAFPSGSFFVWSGRAAEAALGNTAIGRVVRQNVKNLGHPDAFYVEARFSGPV